MQKKVEHKLTWYKKKRNTDIQADRLGKKEIGKRFINYYYLTVKVKKNNGTYAVLISNHVSDLPYETRFRD